MEWSNFQYLLCIECRATAMGCASSCYHYRGQEWRTSIISLLYKEVICFSVHSTEEALKVSEEKLSAAQELLVKEKSTSQQQADFIKRLQRKLLFVTKVTAHLMLTMSVMQPSDAVITDYCIPNVLTWKLTASLQPKIAAVIMNFFSSASLILNK